MNILQLGPIKLDQYLSKFLERALKFRKLTKFCKKFVFKSYISFDFPDFESGRANSNSPLPRKTFSQMFWSAAAE